MNNRIRLNNPDVSMGITAFLIWLVLFVTSVSSVVYGLYLAFTASVILGFVFLFLTPAATVTGLVMFLFGVNLAERLAQALGLS